MAGDFKLNLNITGNITSSLNSIQKKLDKLPEEAYQFFKAQTPIRSGNARRNTKFNKNKDEIQANYPYAQRLDDGYSSQAPIGMTKPTEDFIKKRAKQIMRGKK